MGDNIIEIKNLKKYYKDVHAVDDLTFHVKKGEFFAFLGINGAGKSTTISIMTGINRKDSGTVIIDGKNIDHGFLPISREIGVVFQDSVLDYSLKVKDNLESRAALYQIYGEEFKKRLKELSTILHFEDLLKRPVGKLSGGQRRRIDVARALIQDPKILILDEPTTGLDPQTRKHLWEVIDWYRKEKGVTIFLTTHYMEEVSDADYVVILDKGKIVAEGTPLDLKNEYTGDFIVLYKFDEEEIKKLDLPYTKTKDTIRIEVKNTDEAKRLIVEHPDIFTDFEITKGKMDDVFLAATGKNLEGGF
ncbi:MAG TPA: ABC transporter [Firmicutes bacterium]|nr:ABC transporter [Bacillota bacterium]